MTPEEILEKAKSGDLAGQDLSKSVLKKADLTGAKLSGADLTRSKLTKANLAGADLSKANLTRVDLKGADLRAKLLAGLQVLNGHVEHGLDEAHTFGHGSGRPVVEDAFDDPG